MTMSKTVILRGGPYDRCFQSLPRPAVMYTLGYMPTQKLGRVNPCHEMPARLDGVKTYHLDYVFAYHDYYGEVFTYRDQHNLSYMLPPEAFSGVALIDLFVCKLRDLLDVACLDAEYINGTLTLIWLWRINGDNYQFAHKMPILTALQSRSDIDRVVEFLHNVFLCGVSQHFQYSVDTDESAPA